MAQYALPENTGGLLEVIFDAVAIAHVAEALHMAHAAAYS